MSQIVLPDRENDTNLEVLSQEFANLVKKFFSRFPSLRKDIKNLFQLIEDKDIFRSLRLKEIAERLGEKILDVRFFFVPGSKDIKDEGICNFAQTD